MLCTGPCRCRCGSQCTSYWKNRKHTIFPLMEEQNNSYFSRILWNNRTHPIFPEFSKTIEHLLFFQNSQALSFENPWRAMNITICSISGELLAFSGVCGGERERSLASNDKACSHIPQVLLGILRNWYLNTFILPVLLQI